MLPIMLLNQFVYYACLSTSFDHTESMKKKLGRGWCCPRRDSMYTGLIMTVHGRPKRLKSVRQQTIQICIKKMWSEPTMDSHDQPASMLMLSWKGQHLACEFTEENVGTTWMHDMPLDLILLCLVFCPLFYYHIVLSSVRTRKTKNDSNINKLSKSIL